MPQGNYKLFKGFIKNYERLRYPTNHNYSRWMATNLNRFGFEWMRHRTGIAFYLDPTYIPSNDGGIPEVNIELKQRRVEAVHIEGIYHSIQNFIDSHYDKRILVYQVLKLGRVEGIPQLNVILFDEEHLLDELDGEFTYQFTGVLLPLVPNNA